MLLLAAVWLIVLGYALSFVGYGTSTGKPVSFKEAFFGSADGSPAISGFAPSSGAGSASGGTPSGGGSW